MIRKLIVALTAVAGLVTLCLFFPPSFLKVQEVVVLTPPRHLTEFDLIRLSQVKRGDNLAALRLKKVRENILRFPWVREVRLSKRFPGRLLIGVEEQKPAALVELEAAYFVNSDGEIFKKMDPRDPNDPKDLPVISGLTQDDLETKRSAGGGLPQFISLIRFFETSEILSEIGVSEVRWSRDKGVSVFTKEPAIRLELGEDRWEERAARFGEAWRTIRLTAQRPKIIDLNFEKRIVVKQAS